MWKTWNTNVGSLTIARRKKVSSNKVIQTLRIDSRLLKCTTDHDKRSIETEINSLLIRNVIQTSSMIELRLIATSVKGRRKIVVFLNWAPDLKLKYLSEKNVSIAQTFSGSLKSRAHLEKNRLDCFSPSDQLKMLRLSTFKFFMRCLRFQMMNRRQSADASQLMKLNRQLGVLQRLCN